MIKYTILLFLGLFCAASSQAQCTAPTIAATSKGPDQINLTWAAALVPCYGYLIEIQSAGDSRYLSFTQWQPIPISFGGSSDPTCSWCVNTLIILDTLPTWIVESQYIDPQDGTAAQAIISGLIPNTSYSFRVRTYQGYAAAVYSSYSSTATATTSNYTLRYVNGATGNDSNNGTNSTTLAWATINHGCAAVGAGTALIVIGDNYAQDYCQITHSGTNATNKVVVMANPGDIVTITSTPSGQGIPGIWLTHNFNVIDKINFAAAVNTDNSVFVTGSNDAIFGGNIDNQNIGQGMEVTGNSNLLQGMYVHDVGVQGVDNGECLYVEGVGSVGPNHNIIQLNHLTRCSHGYIADLNQTSTTANAYNQTMNNDLDGGWGNGVEVLAGDSSHAHPNHALVEGNILAFMWQNATHADIKEPLEDEGINDTFRRNISFDSRTNALELNAFRGNTQNNLHYNNTFYRVGLNENPACAFTCGWCMWWGIPLNSMGGYTGGVYDNNICTSVERQGVLLYWYTAGTFETDITLSHNDFIWYNSGTYQTGPATTMAASPDGNNYHTIPYMDINFSPPFASNTNLIADPVFVNPSGYDLHLQTTSPLVGAGISIMDTTWGTISNTNLGAFDGSFTSTVPSPSPVNGIGAGVGILSGAGVP